VLAQLREGRIEIKTKTEEEEESVEDEAGKKGDANRTLRLRRETGVGRVARSTPGKVFVAVARTIHEEKKKKDRLGSALGGLLTQKVCNEGIQQAPCPFR